MYAVDALSDAIDVTREFLTPVRVRTWLKLAVVVLFLTGFGFGMPTAPSGEVQYEVDDTVFVEDPTTGERFDLGLTEGELLTLVLAVVAIALLVWLVFSLVGAFMEFAFVESLRTGEVHVRRFAGQHAGRALRLFGFRLLVSLLAALAVGVPVYSVLTPIDGVGDLSLSGLGAVVFLAFLVGLVYAIVTRLTSEFVVPVMVLEERNVLSAWGRFWPTLRTNLAEYAVYVVLATIIWVVASIAIGVLWFFAALLLAIPFVILAVLLYFLGTIGAILLIPLAIVAVISFLLLMGLIQLPLVAYIRYYALLLLGDTNGELDLIPERRSAIRAAGGWESDDDWGDSDDWDDDGSGWGAGDDSGLDDGSDADRDGEGGRSRGDDGEGDRDGWR